MMKITPIPTTLNQAAAQAAAEYALSEEQAWRTGFQSFLYRLTQEPRVVVAAPSGSLDWLAYPFEFNPTTRFSDLLKNIISVPTGDFPIQATFQFRTPKLEKKLAPLISLEVGEQLTWWFNPKYYTAEDAERIPTLFLLFMENLAQNFEQPCARVSLLTKEQLIEQVEVWNHTESDFRSEASLHGLISIQSNLAPERIAAVYNGEHLSYGEMEQRANRLAHVLIADGVQPGHIVGLYIERDLDLLIAQIAILKTGAAYAALDLQYPREMLARLFDNFDLPYILTHSNLKNLLPEHKSRLLLIDQLLLQKDHPPTAPEVTINSRSAAFIIFTSGSTGVPKGVIHTHRNMLARFQAAWALAAMNTDDVVSQTSPLSSIDAVDEIYSPFLLGARTVMIPHRIVTDPRRLVDLLEKEGVTRMVLVPSLLQIILTAYDDIDRRLARLKTWLIGGEALTAPLVKRFYEKLPKAQLVNFYGLTEGDATFYPVVVSETTPPVGRPVQNTRVYVLDSNLQPVPPGLPGEICLSGEGLFKEYWNRPDLNAEKWQDNPFNNVPNGPFSRLFKTGDMGRWQPDGQLQYLGRRDRMVKIRSFRVELGEVEAALATNPAVRECAVRVWQTGSTDNAVTYQPRIVANAVLKESARDTPIELRDALKKLLPDYALPKQIILLTSLPFLPNGKIDYRSLPEPSETETVVVENFCEPGDEIELFLVKLWERLLSRHPISTRDNFFDLGGDSLIAIDLVLSIEKAYQRSLPISVLMQRPTIAELAELIRPDINTHKWSSLVPIQPTGSRPPLFCIHADGGVLFYYEFARRMDKDQPIYGIQARGLSGEDRPHSSVPQMATDYIAEMRSVQPQGPYYFCAFSLGGMVALEMARQLREIGEPVAFVGLLDAYGPGYPQILSNKNWADYKISVHMNTLQLYDWRGKLNYLYRRVRSRWQKIETSLLGSLLVTLRIPLPQNIRYNYVARVLNDMVDNYRPAVCPGAITLFRSSIQPENIVPNPSLGWKDYVSGEIKIVDVTGTHNSMIKEPHLSLLVQAIQSELQKI